MLISMAGTGNADDDALAPTLVAALQRLAHDLDIADAFERIVHATIGEIDDRGNHVIHIPWIDEVGHAELFGERPLVRVDVHADDAIGAHQPARPE